MSHEPSVSRLVESVLPRLPCCLPAACEYLFASEAGEQPPCRCRPGEYRVLTEPPAQCTCFVVAQADNRCTHLGVLAIRVTADSGPPPKSPSAQQAKQFLLGAVVVRWGREAAARVVGRDDVDGLPVRGRKRTGTVVASTDVVYRRPLGDLVVEAMR